jgi:gas vesicle protein
MMRRYRGLQFFGAGLIIGAAIGALIGVLIAPASGARTRREIANRARDAAETAKALAERAEATAETLGHRVEHYLGRDEEMAWRRVREIREGVRDYTQTQAR